MLNLTSRLLENRQLNPSNLLCSKKRLTVKDRWDS